MERMRAENKVLSDTEVEEEWPKGLVLDSQCRSSLGEKIQQCTLSKFSLGEGAASPPCLEWVTLFQSMVARAGY